MLAFKSGKGTPMHSKMGQLTIPQYVIFKDKAHHGEDTIEEEPKVTPEIIKEFQEKKLLLTLSLA